MKNTKMATRAPQRMDNVMEQSRRQEGRTENDQAAAPAIRGSGHVESTLVNEVLQLKSCNCQEAKQKLSSCRASMEHKEVVRTAMGAKERKGMSDMKAALSVVEMWAYGDDGLERMLYSSTAKGTVHGKEGHVLGIRALEERYRLDKMAVSCEVRNDIPLL
ncbi:Rho Guanine Nucleotide Exchange Factor 19 [Manis pentadactyla]|nr:Rho Guanine Nucleotide Exchange Factor 19 [Manis pentadactyla]